MKFFYLFEVGLLVTVLDRQPAISKRRSTSTASEPVFTTARCTPPANTKSKEL